MNGRHGNIGVFLDRDGTICEEIGYLSSPDQVRLIPGVGEAIRLLNEQGMKCVVVTNQSGIARGFFSEERLAEIHRELLRLLWADGAILDAIYFCPHHPTEGRAPYCRPCGCRKPASGLILRAASELGLDLKRSYCVGDRLADLECGKRVGAKGVLVLTGYGREEALANGSDAERSPSCVVPDLREAVRWILKDLERT
jgi:histidinol-phosphate phosphatase family protein